MTHIAVYTDGACSGNPGPGGWAAVVLEAAGPQELSGGERHTTNNRMEMIAVLEGLKAISAPAKVQIHSDSAYIVNCMKQKWYARWQKNGWRTATGKSVENKDLWEQLLQAITLHSEVEFIKVKGHSDVEWNNRCDLLARQAAQKFQR